MRKHMNYLKDTGKNANGGNCDEGGGEFVSLVHAKKAKRNIVR